MQHQEGCPLSSASAYKAAALQGQANYIPELEDADNERPCPDRRCSTWLDLHTWFGYQPHSLPQIDFQKCFCDIAHGGKGVYERLAVLGEKGLEMMAKVYISDKFSPGRVLPFELQTGFPPDMMRYVWTLKRVDRILSIRALSAFAKTYLSTPQSMPNAACAARYVKALTGYSMQAHSLMRTAFAENHALETFAYERQDSSAQGNRKIVPKETLGMYATSGLVYHWAGILLDHIYDAQKLKNTADPIESELVQDLQEYFGYPYDTVIPRIRNIINSSDTQFVESDFDAQAETGRDIIRLWATNYFLELARNSSLPPETLDRWLRLEVETFMNSQVISIFAATHLNLLPILNHIYATHSFSSRASAAAGDLLNAVFGARDVDKTQSLGVGLAKVERMFLQLLSASYSVVRECDSKRYMPALIQRLRQIQLILHLEELDIRINGPLRSPLALFQGIDVYRWSTISNWGHNNRFGLWQRHPRSDHLEAFLPVSDPVVRRRVRQLEAAAPPSTSEKQGNPTVCQMLCRSIPGAEAHAEGPRKQPIANQIPVGTSPTVITQRFATNKKTGRHRKPTLFSRFFRKSEDNKNTNLPTWRPPFAAFMAPKTVTFNPGEAYVAPHNRRPLNMQYANPPDNNLEIDWGDARPSERVKGIAPTCLSEPVPSPELSATDSSCSSQSSYCSSCSTCVGEAPHDCRGWNSVVRQVQKNLPADNTIRRTAELGPTELVFTKDRLHEKMAIDLYRRRMDDSASPMAGPGLNGAAGVARVPFNGFGHDALNPQVPDAEFMNLLKLGPQAIQPTVSWPVQSSQLGDKLIGMEFDRDPDRHKRLRILTPDGAQFEPPPRNLDNVHTFDITIPR